MHELAICSALLEEVGRLSRERHGRRVLSIAVRLGPLSGVEPGLLARAYTVARAGTPAEGAELTIEAAPVRVRCLQCDTAAEARANDLSCPRCGSWRTELLSGDELLLTRVELERWVVTTSGVTSDV